MGEPTVQVSKVVSAPPESVWRALTTPALLKAYFMGADVDSDFKVGSPIRFRGRFKGKQYEDKGEIRAAAAPQHLEFSHFSPLTGQPDVPENYHVVSFDLEPRSGVTKVTLTQSNLTGGPTESDLQMRGEFEKNWTGVLDGLKKLVESRKV
jgi:uncharacterized protein YndB with AHSA1/START domain